MAIAKTYQPKKANTYFYKCQLFFYLLYEFIISCQLILICLMYSCYYLPQPQPQFVNSNKNMIIKNNIPLSPQPFPPNNPPKGLFPHPQPPLGPSSHPHPQLFGQLPLLSSCIFHSSFFIVYYIV